MPDVGHLAVEPRYRPEHSLKCDKYNPAAAVVFRWEIDKRARLLIKVHRSHQGPTKNRGRRLWL